MNTKVIGVAFLSCFFMTCGSFAQNSSPQEAPQSFQSASLPVLPLTEILDRIEQYYGVSFAYQKKFLQGKLAPYISPQGLTIEEYLTEILISRQLTFRKIENIKESIFIISPQEANEKLFFAPPKVDSAVRQSVVQRRFVTGSVKGASQLAVLPGVNVMLRGTTKGTITDSQGNFSLEIPANLSNRTLVFSYVGFDTEQVYVTNETNLEVVLNENIRALPEIAITALGLSREQKALGYSVSTISGSQLTAAGNTNLGSALYGKAPGVRIRTAPGGATSAVTIQVRGLNSLNYSTQPLYVIDGVIMRDGNERGAAGINNDDYYTDNRIRGNGILDVNPMDIENITVLKGASASALYGSDASSGVVLINTKKGMKRSGAGVEINYQNTQEEVAFTPKYQNTYGPGFDRSRNISLGATADGWVPVDLNGDGIPDDKRPLFESYAQFGPKMDGQSVLWWDGKKHSYSPQPDNYNNFYRKGYSSIFNLALANQIDKWSYRLSYTRTDYAGTQVGGKMERNTVNLHTTLKASSRLQLDMMLNYSNSFVHNRPLRIHRLMSSWDGFFSRAEDMSLFFDKYQTSAGYKWVPFDQSQRNPSEALSYVTPRGYEVMNMLWQQLANSEDELQNRLMSSFTLDYEISKSLRLRGRMGYDITSLSTETRQRNEYPVGFNTTGSTGSYGVATGKYSVSYSDALLSYHHSFHPNLKFTANAGFQARDEKYSNESVSTSGGLVLENWFNLHNSYNPVLNTTRSNIKILKYAYLGSANLNYKDFLFLEATARQEYSSTLPPGYNGYFYPSVNSGFVFSEVMKLPSFLDYAKLRASYGIVGNAPPAYESNILYNLSNLQTANGSVIAATSSGSVYGNNAIRPERKHELEFGLDMRMLHNKLAVDLTYYVSRTYDQILRLSIPGSTGAESILTNVGTLGAHGWELGISATPVSRRIVWNTNLNFAYNTTRLEDLMQGVDQLVLQDLEGSSIRVTAQKGQTLGDIMVNPRKTDSNGNLVINENGLYVIDHTRYVKAGNILPKVTGGFLNTVLYKNFSLQLNFDFSFGGQIVSPALKYGTGSGMYESTLQYRDAAHGGLPYYITSTGDKILLPSHTSNSPDNSPVFHDGMLLKGVKENGSPNTTVIDAATYYINTFDWGNNAWNEQGAIYDNSYVKLREVTLGYTIPKSLTKKIYFQNIRVSLIGRNLLYVWRSLQNLDPEATIGTNWLNQGIDTSAGAATRSYGFAVNLTF